MSPDMSILNNLPIKDGEAHYELLYAGTANRFTLPENEVFIRIRENLGDQDFPYTVGVLFNSAFEVTKFVLDDHLTHLEESNITFRKGRITRDFSKPSSNNYLILMKAREKASNNLVYIDLNSDIPSFEFDAEKEQEIYNTYFFGGGEGGSGGSFKP